MISRISLLAPLRIREYRLLYFGQVISDLGDWLDFLALIVLIVYRWELGAPALAALSMAKVLPPAVLGPFAGVWVDRWPYKTVMITTDLIRAVIVLGLIWAPNLYFLLTLVFLKEIFNVFFDPARAASVHATVSEEDFLAASSLGQLSLQITKVVGPALGGLLVAVAGPRGAFLVDSLTFVASALFLSLLKPIPRAVHPSEGGESSFRSEFQLGFMYILQRRTLSMAVFSLAAALFVIFAFDSLSTLALKELGVGEAILGLAVGSVGLGTAIGAVLIGQWGTRYHPFAIMGIGKMVSGLLVATTGAFVLLRVQSIGVGWVPFWFIVGLTGAAIFVPYGYIMQIETPQALIGRVFSVAGGVQTIFQLFAPPLGAIVAEWLGVGFVFVVAGGSLTLIGLLVVIFRPPMQLNHKVTDPNTSTA